ncbi:MAG: hypothetical protein RL266_1784 [Bacteroidota bacterium]|jgi:hypothetical protein
MQNQIQDSLAATSIEVALLKNITIRECETGFVVALTDDEGFETVRGYGPNPTEAMNDLHRNLI